MTQRHHVILGATSPLTGYYHSRVIPLSETEFRERYRAWREGELLQHAFPMLSDDDREFIKTGLTPEDFNHITKES